MVEIPLDVRRERASLEAERQGELGGAERGLGLDIYGNEVVWEEERRSGEAPNGRLHNPDGDAGSRAGQEHAGRAEGNAAGEAPMQPEGSGRLDGLERGGGGAADGSGEAGTTKHGGESWLRGFMHQQPESYVLLRRTNLGAMLALAALLALFICLAVLDRHQTRREHMTPGWFFAADCFFFDWQIPWPMPSRFTGRHMHASLARPLWHAAEAATRKVLCRRAQWLAVLFGVPGCSLRWYLSRFNYKLHGRWKWLPCGTFAANMTACLVDYIVGVRGPPFLQSGPLMLSSCPMLAFLSFE